MADDTHQPSEEEVTLMLKRAGLTSRPSSWRDVAPWSQDLRQRRAGCEGILNAPTNRPVSFLFGDRIHDWRTLLPIHR